MPLRFMLWLGRITDWDKDAVRIVLFVIAILTSGFMYDWAVRPLIFPEPQGSLSAEEREELTRIIEYHEFPNVEQMLNEAFEKVD